MNIELIIREFIAISQKNPLNQAQFPFGEGMNAQIEVVLPFPESQREDHWRSQFKRVLAQIDHASLGIDRNLGFEPNAPAICQFVFKEMGLPRSAKIAFYRGDGFSTLFYGQP